MNFKGTEYYRNKADIVLNTEAYHPRALSSCSANEVTVLDLEFFANAVVDLCDELDRVKAHRHEMAKALDKRMTQDIQRIKEGKG